MSNSSVSFQPRAVIYARMSSDDQAGSIEQQTGWAEPACQREGLTVAATFADHGISGHATSKRADFHAMLKFCQEAHKRGQAIDVIVCWQANRFSRADSIETGWFLHEFRKVGVGRMLTADRWIDFEKLEDRILLGIEQDVSSNKFSKDLALTTTRGLVENAKKGKRNGGRVPHGYRWQYRDLPDGSRERDKLVPDPIAARVVQWIFDTYSTGQVSVWQLAYELTTRGEPTPSVYSGKGVQGKRWTVYTVREILTNEVYLGRTIWNRQRSGRFFGVVNAQPVARSANTSKRRRTCNPESELIRRENTHEPLVSLELWELVQRRRAERKGRTTPISFPRSAEDGRRLAGSPYSLTGLLVCAHCGARMTGNRISKGADAFVFRCTTYSVYGSSACQRNGILERPLLLAILDKIQERFTPEALGICRELIREQVDTDAESETMGDLEGRLKELDRQLSLAARRALIEPSERLADLYRQEALALQGERDSMAAQLDRQRLALAGLADPDAIVKEAFDIVARFKECADNLTPAEVRVILGDHIERVDVRFTHQQRGTRTFSTFAEATIWLREDSVLSSCLIASPTRTNQARTIILLPSDLKGDAAA